MAILASVSIMSAALMILGMSSRTINVSPTPSLRRLIGDIVVEGHELIMLACALCSAALMATALTVI